VKPLPDLDDTPAMLLRGKRSALAASRNDAEIELRDAYTHLNGADWSEYRARLLKVKECVQRLDTVITLWESI
jgi:hypothetical protein